jgi:hypothetical protein
MLVRVDERRIVFGTKDNGSACSKLLLPSLPIYHLIPKGRLRHGPSMPRCSSRLIRGHGDRMGNLRKYPIGDKLPRSPRTGGCAKRSPSQYNGISVMVFYNAGPTWVTHLPTLLTHTLSLAGSNG